MLALAENIRAIRMALKDRLKVTKEVAPGSDCTHSTLVFISQADLSSNHMLAVATGPRNGTKLMLMLKKHSMSSISASGRTIMFVNRK